MFCPRCRAEYPERFTRCANCGVQLVAALAESSTALGESDSPTILWRGSDPVVFTAILNALRETEIRFHDTLGRDYEAFLSPPVMDGLFGTPGFEIRVLRTDLERAKRILEAVLEPIPTEQPPSSTTGFSSEHFRPTQEGTPENWDPAEATVEVWSGENEAMSEFVADVFRENAIASRLVAEPAGRKRILVRPADQSRARKIIREVVEGTPPA